MILLPLQTCHQAGHMIVSRSALNKLQISTQRRADSLDTSPNKPGTYLIHKVTPDWPELRDLLLRCHLNSGNDSGIGILFRYKDQDNFYFFLMDAQRNYPRIGKKVEGLFRELDEPALDTTTGYTINQDHEIIVTAVKDAILVYLDGSKILYGRDRSLDQSGCIGFYSWRNTATRFLDLNSQSI